MSKEQVPDEKPPTSAESEVSALRAANGGLRQKVRELEAQIARMQEQAQRMLVEAEGKVLELRIALGKRLSTEASTAEEWAAKGRTPDAGQVGPAPAKG